MAKIILDYDEIIEQARASWGGTIGDERAESVKNILDTRLDDYHKVTGFSKKNILYALEKKRNVNTVNFYQESVLPLLKNVYVFETIEDLKNKFSSNKFVCSGCGKISKDPFLCTQDGCNWKSWGLFRGGISVIIKDSFLDHPVPIDMFKPIELC